MDKHTLFTFVKVKNEKHKLPLDHATIWKSYFFYLCGFYCSKYYIINHEKTLYTNDEINSDLYQEGILFHLNKN